MASMEKQIKDHFARVDPKLHAVLIQLEGKTDRLTPTKSTDYFADLCEAIINQQLSDKAAATIYKRFLDLFPKRRVTPEFLLRLKDEQIRGVGTSWNKVKFLTSLARAVVDRTIKLASLDTLPDIEVVTELTKLHGIGPWTAEMFLMFSLGRPDVFSYGDVGLRRAIQKLYALKKEPTPKQMEKISRKWAPYRTYACRILWRSLDT